MKRKVLFSLIAVMMVLSLLLSACGGWAATPAPAETEAPPSEVEAVRVGALYPLTGDLAKLGEENKDGLQLAIDEINAAGGIKSMGGAQIEMVWGDTTGKPEVGISEVERLAQQENVVAIIGAYQSAVTTPATQAAERLSVPFIVSMAVSDKITERGFKYTFRVC